MMIERAAALSPPTVAERIVAIDWGVCAAMLDASGYATVPALLTQRECAEILHLYGDDACFRKRIVMAQHAYGVGEYKYFAYPLPPPIAELRRGLYRGLAPLANAWAPYLGGNATYPRELDEFLDRCHNAGQSKPTPLLLRYEAGGFNCLHQDVYGAVAFPLQVAILLSEPGRDFRGGEFLLVEQRPRAQSRGEVVPLAQGDAVIFANAHRPVAAKRGTFRVNLRHGVSRIVSGQRATLGMIFHDAA
jgi:hypothetical protein